MYETNPFVSLQITQLSLFNRHFFFLIRSVCLVNQYVSPQHIFFSFEMTVNHVKVHILFSAIGFEKSCSINFKFCSIFNRPPFCCSLLFQIFKWSNQRYCLTTRDMCVISVQVSPKVLKRIQGKVLYMTGERTTLNSIVSKEYRSFSPSIKQPFSVNCALAFSISNCLKDMVSLVKCFLFSSQNHSYVGVFTVCQAV